jgi:hypothetical protein
VNYEVHEKRGFYEKVTNVNILSLVFPSLASLFFVSVATHVVLHPVSIRTLCGPETLCRLGSYGEVDAASFRSASLRAQPRAQSSERGIVATLTVISLSQAAAA